MIGAQIWEIRSGSPGHNEQYHASSDCGTGSDFCQNYSPKSLQSPVEFSYFIDLKKGFNCLRAAPSQQNLRKAVAARTSSLRHRSRR